MKENRKAEFLAAGVACEARFLPTPGLIEGTYHISRLSEQGLLISVASVSHC